MVSVESHIRKSLFYNHGHERPVPVEVIELSCRFAGYEPRVTRQRLDELVEEGVLYEEDGCYRYLED